jgi:hypothetical protein
MFGVIDLVSIAAILGSVAFVVHSIRIEMKANTIN